MVLFALGLLTALMAMVSAVSTYVVAPANNTVILTLGLLCLAFLTFSLSIHSGRFPGLFSNDQLFWDVIEMDR